MTGQFFSVLFHSSSIAVWAIVKKKPLIKTLHATSSGGDQEGERGEEGEGEGERGEEGEGVGKGWVTAVAAFPNSDLVASGTCTCMYVFAQPFVYFSLSV